MLHSLRRFKRDEVAKERLRILQFYDKHGEEATREAFGVDRKVIYVWRKKVQEQQGHLDALIPLSTRPIRARKAQTDPRIVQFIRQIRRGHPRIGKEKIKPFPDRYCLQLGNRTTENSFKPCPTCKRR